MSARAKTLADLMTSKTCYAVQVKVTRADLLLLGELADKCQDPELKDGLVRVFEKCERSADRITKQRGINVNRFFEICKEEIGDRLIFPPDPSPGWYTKMSNALKLVGIMEDNQARAVAIYANRFLRPGTPIDAQRLVYNASEYYGLARQRGILQQDSKPLGLED